MNAENKIGNIQVGNEADLIIIDLSSTDEISQRYLKSKNFVESYFPTIMMGDDRAIKAVWVNGNLIKSK